MQDEDYQTNVNMMCTTWSGFSDPHSNIISYRIGIGNNPTIPDLTDFKIIGLRQGTCSIITNAIKSNIDKPYDPNCDNI